MSKNDACFGKENVIANDMQSATKRRAPIDKPAKRLSIGSEDKPNP